MKTVKKKSKQKLKKSMSKINTRPYTDQYINFNSDTNIKKNFEYRLHKLVSFFLLKNIIY